MSPPKEKAPARQGEGSHTTGTAGTTRTANGTEPGVQLLLRNLQNVQKQKRPHPSWRADCPCHDDTEAKLQIDYREGRYGPHMLLMYCRTCGSDAGLPEFCKAAGVLPVDVQNNNHQLLADVKPPVPPAPLPTPAAINGWCRNLARNSEAIIYLRDRRGINYLTANRYRIGHDGKRFTLPVYCDGKVVNLRRYLPDAIKPERKMQGLPGHTADQLYPSMPVGPEVVVCEGEWDTLIARQHGFPAVTTTAGKDGKLVHWVEQFRGRDVVIIYDCGKAQASGRRRAEEVVGVARLVKVVDLGLDEGEDVTDWFVKYHRTAADLRWIIEVTEPFA